MEGEGKGGGGVQRSKKEAAEKEQFNYDPLVALKVATV